MTGRFKHGLWQSLRFVAENQDVPFLKLGFVIRMFCPFGEQPAAGWGQFLQERRPVVDSLPLEVLPVVQPCPSEMMVVQAKTERSNQPEFCPHGNTGTTNTSRIVRDFRFEEDDVKSRVIMHGGDIVIKTGLHHNEGFWGIDPADRKRIVRGLVNPRGPFITWIFVEIQPALYASDRLRSVRAIRLRFRV